mmetsp:Transcript_19168/g.52866  ORF Transcript_19168/g.52866 Transcript_19168/m.52866 type:complete len:226 (-) Transcript_19168:1839-2516(-)
MTREDRVGPAEADSTMMTRREEEGRLGTKAGLRRILVTRNAGTRASRCASGRSRRSASCPFIPACHCSHSCLVSSMVMPKRWAVESTLSPCRNESMAETSCPTLLLTSRESSSAWSRLSRTRGCSSPSLAAMSSSSVASSSSSSSAPSAEPLSLSSSLESPSAPERFPSPRGSPGPLNGIGSGFSIDDRRPPSLATSVDTALLRLPLLCTCTPGEVLAAPPPAWW